MRLHAEELIERPSSEVFEFVATEHFENHPKWDSGILSMTPTAPGPVRRGSTARLVRSDRGRRSEGVITVTEYEPDRYFAATSQFGPFQLNQRVVCDPVTGDRTRLRLTIDIRAAGMTRFLLPLLRRQFQQTMADSLRTIKQHVESTETP